MTAAFRGMTNVTFIMLVLMTVGLIIELLAAASAPLGYQDKNGFHHGCESASSTEEPDCGNPS